MAEIDVPSLFRSLDPDRTNVVWKWRLLEELKQTGLQADDPRVAGALERALATEAGFEPGQPEWLDYKQFHQAVQEPVIGRALQGELSMRPDEFAEFTRGVERIYTDLQDERSGEVAQYISTLRNADPERFGIAVCTGDGQVFMIGDAGVPFSVQSTWKPFSYAMALEEHGADGVHQWVGQEQSGGKFNDPRLSLDAAGKPQNPMINAGAMATLALVESHLDVDERFAKVEQTSARMMGAQPGFDHRTFLAERQTGSGNRGLANLMAAQNMLKVDPKNRSAPEDAAEFYFAVCSLEVDARRLAAAGATLANGGVSPFSGERIFSAETTARVLAVMGHSGMYNDSGEFAGHVGLPAKSGVSGNVMMVVPDRNLAVVTFSPRLDAAGNSVRGVEVCKRLVAEFGLHPYQGIGAQRGPARVAFEGMPQVGTVAHGTALTTGPHNFQRGGDRSNQQAVTRQ
jgi:glutaminase